MRRIVMMAIMCLVFATSGFAQFKRGVFNHLGVNVGVGTEGIGFGVAAPLTNFLEVEAGMNVMPGFNLSADVDVEAQGSLNVNGVAVPIPNSTVNAKADFSRTTGNLKANVYPFGKNSKFFVAAGFSFGGSKIAKIKGHSEELESFIGQYPAYKDEILNSVSAEISDYNLKLDENCDIKGDIRCNSFRPYLGLGFGRLVPKNRIGFRVEMGCQFMGSLKVYQNGEQLDINKILSDTMDKEIADDISKFIDNWKWYPVLKFQIVGRIL